MSARAISAQHVFAAEYFAEEVRREILERYGEKKLYEGGLSVRTTLDPKMQLIARKALIDGLINYDESAGLSRPGQQDRHDRRLGRQARRCQGAVGRHAVAHGGGARGQRPVGAHRLPAGARARRRGVARRARPASLPLDGVKWAKAASGPARGKRAGEGHPGARGRATSSMSSRSPARTARRSTVSIACARCRKSPARMVVMDPWTGRVLAMVGGFSFDQSQFNRATQALSPARLVVQAVRLCGRARQRLHALDAW